MLVSDGADSIRIDPLCKRAGRTKGSFYHHFSDRDTYVTDLLAHWERQLTRTVIEKTGSISDPVTRLRLLNTLSSGIDVDLERALRRWAGSDSIVEEAVARVDKRRVDYLARLWQEAKSITSQQAIDLAIMDYAAMVGFQQLYVPVTRKRRARIDGFYGQLMKCLPDRN